MYIFESAARPRVGYAVIRPKALHEGQVLFEPLDTFAFRDAEGIELDVAVAQADTEDEVAPGDDIQRRHRLGRVDGIMQVEQQMPRPIVISPASAASRARKGTVCSCLLLPSLR